MSPQIMLVKGEQPCQTLVLYLLLKCNYGDGTHIQENKAYYTDGSRLQRDVYMMWKRINNLDLGRLSTQIRWQSLPLDLDRYLL